MRYFTTTRCTCFMIFLISFEGLFQVFKACIEGSWMAPLMSVVTIIGGLTSQHVSLIDYMSGLYLLCVLLCGCVWESIMVVCDLYELDGSCWGWC